MPPFRARLAQVISIIIGSCLVGACADPFIESTTILADTRDVVGPYVVDTVVIGTSGADRVELRIRRADGPDRVIEMFEVADDGDAAGDVFRGLIAGRPVGTEIAYAVTVVRDAEIVDRDPPGPIADDVRFVFSVLP